MEYTTMKLKKLLKDIPVQQVKGSKELAISGICANSKLVAPGNLFIAKKGLTNDGARYIPEAVAAGATAVLTDIYDPLLSKKIVQIIHPNVAAIEGLLAAHYYQFASDELYMVGITGTNGKTTTSYLIKHLLDTLNLPCGLLGTIEYIIGEHRYQASRTTQDVTTNHKMLREMVLQHCRCAVMEVTSHALDQGRVDQIDFDAAIFTNLTPDHLDYHRSLEEYASAKQRLFTSLDPKKKKKNIPFPKVAIVNSDSPHHKLMLQHCRADVITYGLSAGAALQATHIDLLPHGTDLTVSFRGQTARLLNPYPGRFNVYNALAAIAVGLNRGIPLQQVADIIAKAPPVPGRMEAVPNALSLKIFVDFAHTSDALLNVLECLKEFKTGRLITVFGCGGDRDASKRPLMAQACERFSDVVIVTSDNPRSEKPEEIARQIVAGFTNKPARHLVELDRRKAIETAIDMAKPEDVILIAGKGHENHQVFAHQTVPFDDREIATHLCRRKAARQDLQPLSTQL